MSRIFLQPASGTEASANYDASIRSPVPLEEVLPRVSDRVAEELEDRYPGGSCWLWGTREGRKSRIFRMMDVGDEVLFYRKQRFVKKTRVTLTIDSNPVLADHIWGPDHDGRQFEHIFFLEEPEEIDVPYSTVWNITEHGPENALLGLEVVADEHTEEVARALQLEIAPDRDPIQDHASEAADQALESGQGFVSSAAVRKALEDHSMDRAEAYYQNKGFSTHDVSSRKPYDIRCEQGDLTIHVEVKGTQTRGEQVNLTRNEVEFAREHADRMVLFIVHSIEVEEKEDGTAVARGGTRKLYQPWDVDAGELQVISYRYEVPDGS